MLLPELSGQAPSRETEPRPTAFSFVLAWRFQKPKPEEARTKLGLSGQAGPCKPLLDTFRASRVKSLV